MDYTLSIIIPIYNVENYICECLDSVFSQIDKSVEVIIINDDTPDNSIEIIKSQYSNWINKDQIILLEQKHLGPGAARNNGLAIARGKYIGFLDSDDILLPGYFNEILSIINQYNAEIIQFHFKRFTNISNIENNNITRAHSSNGFFGLNTVRNEIFSFGSWFPCIRVFKKGVFNDIIFKEQVFYEDLMTIPFIFMEEYNIYLLDSALIGYRYNPISTTSVHTESQAYSLLDFYLTLVDMDETVSINILKIHVARSISYFYSELSLVNFPINKVLNNLKNIKPDKKLLKNIKYPDFLFFRFTSLYMILNKFRILLKMALHIR